MRCRVVGVCGSVCVSSCKQTTMKRRSDDGHRRGTLNTNKFISDRPSMWRAGGWRVQREVTVNRKRPRLIACSAPPPPISATTGVPTIFLAECCSRGSLAQRLLLSLQLHIVTGSIMCICYEYWGKRCLVFCFTISRPREVDRN